MTKEHKTVASPPVVMLSWIRHAVEADVDYVGGEKKHTKHGNDFLHLIQNIHVK